MDCKSINSENYKGMINISDIHGQNNMKKSKKTVYIIIIVAICSIISILLLNLIPFLLDPGFGNRSTHYLAKYHLSGTLDNTTSINANNYTWQNLTFFNVNSSLIQTNQEKTVEMEICNYYPYWNGTYFVLSYQDAVIYEYNDSFINYVYFNLYLNGSASAPDHYYLYFWNFSSNSFEYNSSFSSIKQVYIHPDFYQEGQIKYQVNGSSANSFLVTKNLSVDFNFSIYTGNNIVLYGDLGNGYKNILEEINWSSPYDIFTMSILWSNSSDNSSWYEAENQSTFSGFGDRYLKLNLSIEVFSDNYFFNINVTYQNCSYYYFNLNETVSACGSNSFADVQNREQISFNLTFSITNSTILTDSQLYIYNYSSNNWLLLGNFFLSPISNLNFTHFIDLIGGIQVRFIANATIDFTINYNFNISFIRPY
ncbi:MAG: hypothetical protein EAX96_05015 [Candidatus Lokiarchaeota archaeon]|nr:hypothetical protein [Candidatus Lokiarchaeota archaeon]